MSSVVESIENRAIARRPGFAAGDRVRVHFQVVEGTRRRTQVFEGIVIKRQGSGARETFTVRKQSFGVGVERTFPLHSPKIEELEVAARGAVRRAKLYYLRDKVGKKARVAERRWGIDEDALATEVVEAIDAEGVGLDEASPAPEPEVPAAPGEDVAEKADQGSADTTPAPEPAAEADGAEVADDGKDEAGAGTAEEPAPDAESEAKDTD